MTKRLNEILIRENLIKDYDELKTLNSIARKYNVSNVTIKNYFVKYNIKYDKQKRYQCDHDLFSHDTEKSFYLAGLLAADGNLRISKGTPYVRLYLAEQDISLLQLFKELTQSSAPIKKTRNAMSKKVLNRLVKQQALFGIDIASEKMFSDLKRFNIIPNKTITYSIPDFIINHPLANHFLRGLADGDGSWCLNNKQLHFSIIGTFDMIKTYQNILNENCISIFKNRKLYQNKSSKNCYVLSYGGNKISNEIANFLYKGATIYMQRKYKYISHYL